MKDNNGGIIHDDDCFCPGCYGATWPKTPNWQKWIKEAKRAIEREKATAQQRQTQE